MPPIDKADSPYADDLKGTHSVIPSPTTLMFFEGLTERTSYAAFRRLLNRSIVKHPLRENPLEYALDRIVEQTEEFPHLRPLALEICDGKTCVKTTRFITKRFQRNLYQSLVVAFDYNADDYVEDTTWTVEEYCPCSSRWLHVQAKESVFGWEHITNFLDYGPLYTKEIEITNEDEDEDEDDDYYDEDDLDEVCKPAYSFATSTMPEFCRKTAPATLMLVHLRCDSYDSAAAALEMISWNLAATKTMKPKSFFYLAFDQLLYMDRHDEEDRGVMKAFYESVLDNPSLRFKICGFDGRCSHRRSAEIHATVDDDDDDTFPFFGEDDGEDDYEGFEGTLEVDEEYLSKERRDEPFADYEPSPHRALFKVYAPPKVYDDVAPRKRSEPNWPWLETEMRKVK